MRLVNRVLGSIVFTLSVLLTSCIDYPISGIKIDEIDVQNLPQFVRLNVPHISQNDNYSCATTSLAMAISYYGGFQPPLDKEEAWTISKIDKAMVKRFGNDMNGLERLANHFGFTGEYANQLSIEVLEYLLSKNLLVVLNVRPDPNQKYSHAVLLVGYDRANQVLFIEDPNNLWNQLGYKDLEERWSAFLSSPFGMSYRSAFIIYPKRIGS